MKSTNRKSKKALDRKGAGEASGQEVEDLLERMERRFGGCLLSLQVSEQELRLVRRLRGWDWKAGEEQAERAETVFLNFLGGCYYKALWTLALLGHEAGKAAGKQEAPGPARERVQKVLREIEEEEGDEEDLGQEEEGDEEDAFYEQEARLVLWVRKWKGRVGEEQAERAEALFSAFFEGDYFKAAEILAVIAQADR